MDYYIEQGTNRKDCELKIMEKYKRPFHILNEKPVKIGGIMGLFSKPGVEVEFYFSPVVNRNPAYQSAGPIYWQTADRVSDFEGEKRKILAAAGKPPGQTAADNGETSQQILDSIKEIKEIIGSAGAASPLVRVKQNFHEDHPALVRAAELLKLNDFSQKYTGAMLERLRKELPLEKLDDPDVVNDTLLEWIGESIRIYNQEEIPAKSKVMVLVGPTGVGKTTTIAKLAAIFGLGTSKKSSIKVRMITIDAFRIGARAQLESYGNIMQLPVAYIDNKLDLKKEIALFSEETDLFLVDTIGKSPKDSVKLGEMKDLLEGCRGAQTHLVLSAGTKTSDIEDILRQFEPFNYKSVILTKMDETNHIGNVISALEEKGKPVSYVTDGQKVPNDIKKATVVRFLINLEDFKVDREKVEKRFPIGEADQFKWG